MKLIKPEVNVIDCKEAAKRFNDFMDNYLQGKSKEELVHHVANCRHCFDRLEFEQLLKAKIATVGLTSSINKKTAKKHIENILSKF